MAYFEATKIKDSAGNLIDPVDDAQVVLLRRIVKLMESQAAVDPQQRQRITIDNVSAGITNALVVTQATATNLNATVSIAASQTLATVTNLAGLFSWNQQILSDPARTAYNTGIRSQLTFS
jgi:microcompartment protein CcmK/EutM